MFSYTQPLYRQYYHWTVWGYKINHWKGIWRGQLLRHLQFYLHFFLFKSDSVNYLFSLAVERTRRLVPPLHHTFALPDFRDELVFREAAAIWRSLFFRGQINDVNKGDRKINKSPCSMTWWWCHTMSLHLALSADKLCSRWLLLLSFLLDNHLRLVCELAEYRLSRYTYHW